MARRKRVFAVSTPIEWVEPPVAKEEALNPMKPGTWEPDGYDGGSELPKDFEIDRMVYPHPEGPMERQSRERRVDRKAQAEEFREAALQQSRSFRIAPGNPTGESPGPPSLYDDD